MENCGDPIPRKKKGTKVMTKKHKIKSVKADAVEKGRTYGIDSLNLDDTTLVYNDSILGEENSNGHDSE